MTTPLVFNTGALTGLTPYKADFINYKPVDIEIKAVGSTGKVVGTGTTLWRFTTRCGRKVYLSSTSLHMPSSDIRLESPQSIIRWLGGVGKALLNSHNIEWHLPCGKIIDIPIDHHTNLPLIRDFVCSDAEIEQFGVPQMHSTVSIRPSKLL